MIRQRRSRVRFVWAGVGLAVVIGLVVAGVLWASAGSQGQIVNAPPDKKVIHGPAYQNYDGPYMTFSYLSTYQNHKLDAKDPDLDLAMLTADTNYDKRLAVSVSKLTGGGLDNNSAYLLRQSQPDTYTSSNISVNGSSAIVWIKKDGLERTVFIPHGDKVAMLAFTTTGNLDNLQPEVDALLASYRWKG
jgi:hypothetical protein